MVQHGSAYKILDTLGCTNGEDVCIVDLEIAHNKASKSYNLRSRKVNFKKEQIIFRKNHVLSNMSKRINRKFLSKYLKCRIRDKVGNNLYDLEDEKGNYFGKYHAIDLKTCPDFVGRATP